MAMVTPALISKLMFVTNDGLRGLSLSLMKTNLETMLKKCKAAGIKVLLLATYLPPNYGPVYTKQFNQVFQDLAKTYNPRKSTTHYSE